MPEITTDLFWREGGTTNSFATYIGLKRENAPLPPELGDNMFQILTYIPTFD